jgi:hypothetical protein
MASAGMMSSETAQTWGCSAEKGDVDEQRLRHGQRRDNPAGSMAGNDAWGAGFLP